MGNSPRKAAAIKQLLDEEDCPPTTCSASSDTLETDAVWNPIRGSAFWDNHPGRLLSEKLERERNEVLSRESATNNARWNAEESRDRIAVEMEKRKANNFGLHARNVRLTKALQYIASAGLSARHMQDEARKALSPQNAKSAGTDASAPTA